MKIPILKSIQTAVRRFETNGSKPILVTCSDLNDYVCKYNAQGGTPNRLLCEYIGAYMCRLWNIGIPDFAFVNVRSEHIDSEWAIPYRTWEQCCFGVKYNESYVEITRITTIDGALRKRFPSRHDLLYIALFDLWLSNEDRSEDNYNLLHNIADSNKLVPIDHECIFNFCNISSAIVGIEIYDSIIASALFHKLFIRKDLEGDVLTEIEKKFYFYTQKCEDEVEDMLSQIPLDWGVDVESLRQKFHKEIFSAKWKKETFDRFLSFIHLINLH